MLENNACGHLTVSPGDACDAPAMTAFDYNNRSLTAETSRNLPRQKTGELLRVGERA
jgi:hypothetical protein